MPRWLFWTLFLGIPVTTVGLWLAGMPGRSGDLTVNEGVVKERIRADIEMLARTIGPRSPFKPGPLAHAAEHIRSTWSRLGYQVHEHPYKISYPFGGQEVRNLEVIIEGTDASLPCVVVGAHYDTESGSNTPGADDNASGVALLLELSRALADAQLARTLRLVAFVCEEPPFFQTDEMGSLSYARKLDDEGVSVELMVSLESLGYYSQEEGSQKYPAGLGLAYPSRGNFVGVVGNLSSRRVMERVARLLMDSSSLPVETGAIPAFVPGVGWSDHWSFWQVGVPAVMLTDTAPFRNPHYHERTDTVGISFS